MARPRSLSPVTIAQAALRVIERDGLPALSMRLVASELGVGTMSLYRYVEGREQLESLVVELVLKDVDTQLTARASWSHKVSTLLTRARRAIGAHPAVVPLVLVRRQSLQASLAWGEALLSALAEAGLCGERRAIAFRTLLGYAIGSAQLEHLGPLSGAGTATLAELPHEQFPHLAETAKHAPTITPDAEFARGLELILTGITAQLG